MTPAPDPGAPPVGGVRTTRRRGRTSAAKEAALRDLLPRFAAPLDDPWPASLRSALDDDRPIALDIGVGTGEATVAWARDRPDLLVVALELHRPGLARLLDDLEADDPGNVRVAEADAHALVHRCQPGALTAVRLLFPDPWPKRRHVGRRMVDRAFAAAVADALAPGGELHVATDWDDYAEHARSMVAAEPRLVARSGDRRVDRPTTAYEARGLAAGRRITDLVWARR